MRSSWKKERAQRPISLPFRLFLKEGDQLRPVAVEVEKCRARTVSATSDSTASHVAPRFRLTPSRRREYLDTGRRHGFA